MLLYPLTTIFLLDLKSLTVLANTDYRHILKVNVAFLILLGIPLPTTGSKKNMLHLKSLSVRATTDFMQMLEVNVLLMILLGIQLQGTG